MMALTADELMAWVERTTEGWRSVVQANPETLGLPCDVRETNSVGELLQHIVAVELRYAERLAGLAETSYELIGKGSGEELFATHDRAMALLRDVLSRSDVAWVEPMQFATRSAGTIQASRRTVLVHLLMHSVRHYAQLATLVRQHGIKPGWPMDYLFMGAKSIP